MNLNQPVYFDLLDILDDKVFTLKIVNTWKRQLLASYKVIYEELNENINPEFPIQFFLNYSLLDEVIIDAVIGLKKVTYSLNNDIVEPNSFKVAAYLTYWWLRHKPVSTHFPDCYLLKDVTVKMDKSQSDEEYNELNAQMAWKLSHINEYVATLFALTYIFDFKTEICSNQVLNNIKMKNNNFVSFDNNELMKNDMTKKLLYYLSYRAIAPKILEQILESYTIHPVWKLTGNHWKV